MNPTILFEVYEEFLQTKEASIPRFVNTNSEKIHEIFRNFKYPISSWPVVITNEMSNELHAISTIIPKLLQEIVPLYFENDIQKVADFYFEGNTTYAEFALMCLEKKIDISSRLDLTYTNDGFKILEINLGSSLGGMEFQNLEPLVRDLHSPLQDIDVSHQYIFRDTQSIYIKFITEKIQEYVVNLSDEINIFLVTEDDVPTREKQAVQLFFEDLLKKELQTKNKHGNVFMSTMASLKFNGEQLQFKEHKIQGVLILDFALKDMSMDVFRAYIARKVYFPDHFGVNLLRDKRNLLLLRKLAEAGKFSAEENKLILKHIPWTEIVKEGTVTFQDTTHSLVDLLKTNKDKFVVKVVDGLQGIDVYLGKYTTQENWEKVVSKAFESDKYIVQEVCESIDIWAPNDENKWIHNKLIWGSFGFGKTYAGVFVRMSPNNSSSGVINSATGAIEAIVYEHQKKHVLTV